MDKLEEIDKFLKICNLKRINHKETENLNRLIMSTEIETVMKNPNKEKPIPYGFTGEFNQTFWELIPSLLKFFQKAEEKGTLSNTFWGQIDQYYFF